MNFLDYLSLATPNYDNALSKYYLTKFIDIQILKYLYPYTSLFFFLDPAYKVQCSPDEMVVQFEDTEQTNNFYLQHLKKYPGIFALNLSSDTLSFLSQRQSSFIIFRQNLIANVILDKACKPRREDGKITFRLNLANIYECSVTKVVDRESVRKIFVHHF